MDKDVNTAVQKENIHAGHRQRVRDKFLSSGIDGFNEHQIVEFLLFYGCPRRDTNELAHRLINKFGSIAGVFDASVNDLLDVEGMNQTAAALLKLIPQCMQIYYASQNQNICINTTEKMKSAFSSCFIGKNNEEFRVMCFDNDLHIISSSVICSGGPSSADVNMRRIAEAALKAGSSLIAVGHNHPSGSTIASVDDIRITKIISETMRSIGIRLLDHIIIGQGTATSMRDSGVLTFFN